jgi:hypothetical protein
MLKPILYLLAVIFITACVQSGEKELTEQEKHIADSISKVQQRAMADSLKKRNPLLILPPDSTYTGSYVDKYSTGITKFTGFFRFGQRHGQWLSFYPSGILWSEMHYDKGLREGPNMVYFENGKPRYTGFYKKDMQDSIWCYYDSSGNLAEKLVFKKDRVVQKMAVE